MRDHGIAHDSAALEQRWLLRMQGLALALGRVPVVWEEAFGRAGAGLDPKTLVHVWKWWGEGREREQGAAALASARRLMAGRMAWEGPGWAAEATTTRSMPLGPGLASPGPEDPRVWAAKLSAVTAAGHGALLSAPWYLNLGTFAEEDWKRYYAADPTAFPARNSTQVRAGGPVAGRGHPGKLVWRRRGGALTRQPGATKSRPGLLQPLLPQGQWQEHPAPSLPHLPCSPPPRAARSSAGRRGLPVG